MPARERARVCRPRRLEQLALRVFMLQAIECSRRGPLRGGCELEDRIGVSLCDASGQHELYVLSERLDSVPSGLGRWMHGFGLWSRYACSTRARLIASSRAYSRFFSTS